MAQIEQTGPRLLKYFKVNANKNSSAISENDNIFGILVKLCTTMLVQLQCPTGKLSKFICKYSKKLED